MFDFELPDPTEGIWSRLARATGGGRPPLREERTPYTPEEMTAHTQGLLGHDVPGLGYLGHVLSTPGDYARGLLAGRPGTRVGGRELLDRWGLTDPRSEGWGPWLGGLAADIVTDPLTYMPFGPTRAATKAGKALGLTGDLAGWGRKALMEGFHTTESAVRAAHAAGGPLARFGPVEDVVAHLAQGKVVPGFNAAPLRMATAGQEQIVKNVLGRDLIPGEAMGGMFGVGIPFGGPSVAFRGGPVGDILATGLDKLGDYLKFQNRFGRKWNQLFDPRVMNAADEVSQRANIKEYANFQRIQAEGRRAQVEMLRGLDPIMRAHPDREQDILTYARALGEGATTGRFAQADPALFGKVQTAIGDRLHRPYRTWFEEARRTGVSLEDWLNPEGLRYMRRTLLLSPEGKLLDKYSVYPSHMSINIHREQDFNQLGGTARIDQWAKQFGGSQQAKGTIAGSIYKDMMADALEDQARRGVTGGLDAATRVRLRKQAGDIAGHMQGLSEVHQLQGLPLYNPDIIKDYHNYGYMFGRKLLATRALQEALASVAEPFRGARRAELIPLAQIHDVIRGFPTYGINVAGHALPATPGQEITGMIPEVLRRYAQGPLVGPLVRQPDAKALYRAAGQVGIPRAALGPLLESYSRGAMPQALQGPLGWWDSFSNLFKSLAYPIWPASQAQNILTAGVVGLQTPTKLKDYAAQLRMLRRPAPTPEDLGWIERMFAAGNIGGGMDIQSELAGHVLPTTIGGPAGRITMPLPMTGRRGPTGTLAGDVAHMFVKEGIVDTMRALGRTARDVVRSPRDWQAIKQSMAQNLGIKGVAGVTEDMLPAVRAGRIGTMNAEDFMRGAQFRGLVNAGYSDEQAANIINRLQFDYSMQTDFERNVMKRIFPFYTFMSRNLPLQLQTLAARPGIAMAQMYPGMQGRHKNEYVPDYLAGNVSIPLGPTGEPGHQRFVGTLGLPLESALAPLSFKGGIPDVPMSMMKFMAGANPLIKLGLETTFGKQLYSGRELADIKAGSTMRNVGRLFGEENPQFLSQLVAQSPFSRFVTTADRLFDPRKAWYDKGINLFTGAHITDVDVPKQRAIEARTALNELMKGMPEFAQYANWYIRPEARGHLSPEATERFRELITMQKAAEAFVQERNRRLAAGGSPVGLP